MSKLLWRSTLGARSPELHPLPSTMFGETALQADLPLPSTLPQDIARSFEQLGVIAFRASIVNIDSLAFQAAWTISEHGEVADSPVDRPLDSSFPAATAAINLLAESAEDETLVHRLSPRRWGLAWRLDDLRVVLSEVQFHARRDVVGDADKTLLRLICGVAMPAQGGVASAAAVRADSLAEAAPGTDRPASTAWLVWFGLGLALIGALLAGGLVLTTVPELRRQLAERETQLTQARALADKTLARGMATALATGDYGDVQTALGGFAALGYFDGAAVINQRQRVVALSGGTDPLRIGDAVPPAVQSSAQVVALVLGSDRLGQLLILPAPAPPAAAGLPRQLVPLAAGAALAAAGAALALLLERWLARWSSRALALRQRPPGAR
ncbi:MAG: hypothetical protein A3E25_00275 [Burkholderiales bacterium RIFCSPHIGHO2_12_FULL_69_20]|nr:MAG: hypothetical protein A3E25_00275 [Burkholderiales bacterium RIFCSPHIGHO2_12_FULL_69_20]